MSVSETIKAELLSLCPAFAGVWAHERDLWTSDDGSFTVHGVFAVFSDYIAERLAHAPDPEMQKVFEYVESKLTGDNSEVDNAACTCFLENLMNRVPDKIPAGHLVPFLGPKSRGYCLAWDDWCGIKPKGWDNWKQNPLKKTQSEALCVYGRRLWRRGLPGATGGMLRAG
jgi:hypothetical protein